MSQLDAIRGKLQREVTLESGNKYTVRMIPGRKGMRLGTKLLKAAAPAMGTIADSLMSEDDDLYGESQKFTKVAGAVMECMNDLEFDKLVDELLEYAKIQEPDQMPRDLDIDNDFMANYDELLEVVAFSIKENFGSLFTGKLIAPLLGKVKSMTGDLTPKE